MKASLRSVVIGLVLFLVTTTTMSWLVYATLDREVTGDTTAYSAVFTDVFGLREGDDVRVAGVRVGRVQKVELGANNTAKVSFDVQSEQRVLRNTEAAVLYQNIVGQRYLGLRLGKTGDPTPLPAGSEIPLERTVGSFDVGVVLNGFEPLFATIDPDAADKLTNAAIQSLQGDSTSWASLIDQTDKLTSTFAGRDQLLGDTITGMDKLFGTLAKQNDNLDGILKDSRKMVDTFNSRRPELVSSMGSITKVVRQLSAISDEVDPSFKSMLTREPGFVEHLVSIEPQLAFTGANLPIMLKGLARLTSEGAYVTVYACDLNATGFFPGLNDIVPIIVNAATPGNNAMYSPRCRNLANG